MDIIVKYANANGRTFTFYRVVFGEAVKVDRK